MANVNNPFGMRPEMRTLAGGAPQLEMWTKAANYAAAIYKWDPVTLVAGVLKGPASGITPGTTNLFGVSIDWAVASVLTNHHVMVSPDAVYSIQGDGSTGANVVAAKMGYKANLLFSTAGGGVTRDNSGAQLDENTINTTSSLDLLILNLLNTPDNAYGANARLEVKINKHLRTGSQTST